MPLQLNLGSTKTFEIRQLDRTILWQNKATTDFSEYNDLAYSIPCLSKWRAIILVARNESFKLFMADLFLPTFINHALHVNGFALKFLASIGGIAIDLVTLIPRATLMPFRLYYLIKHPPIHPILKRFNNDPDIKNAILKDGYVSISKILSQTRLDADPTCARKEQTEQTQFIAIKPLFSYSKNLDVLEIKSTTQYRHDNVAGWEITQSSGSFTRNRNEFMLS